MVSYSSNEYLLFSEKDTPLTVFISWLNLDLGIETCFLMVYLPTVRCGYNLSFLCTSGALQGSSLPCQGTVIEWQW